MALTVKLEKYIHSFDRWDIGLLVVCLGFYLFFPLFDGPVWCVDSLSYATMNISREPLYPTFLWIFRKLFTQEGYLLVVVITQSLIAAYASWKLAVTIRRYHDSSRILAVLAVVFQFCVTILCRFVANRGSSYINSIMTEGLGLSLYVLFVIQLYRYVMEEKWKNLAGAAVYALLLVNLRKQMLVTLCLMAAVFILYYLIKKQKIKKLLLLLALTGCIFFVSKGTDKLYNYVVRGAWIEHSGNSMGMLCSLIYTSGPEDAGLFKEQALQTMYEDIYAQSVEQQLKIENAPEGWVGLSSHYADSYDAIGYGIINPVVQSYIEQNYDYSEVEAAKAYDRYCGEMVQTLLGQEKTDLARVYLSNTWKGFINSIARVNSLLNWYALLAYLLYLGLYVILVNKKGFKVTRASTALAEIVFGGTAINALVVGAMIFCQPRYMIYNMGLFYLALAAMVYDLYKEKKKSP